MNVQLVVASTGGEPIIDGGGACQQIVEVGSDDVFDAGEVGELAQRTTSERWPILGIRFNTGAIETYQDDPQLRARQ